jgi:8-oxo-dGTP pyrophosphatase MutT (NUDIX family)
MSSNIISELGNRLREKLPGEKAHFIMAPAGNLPENISGEPGKAGVLILLFPHNGELSTVLIKRTEYPGPHSGQISLPGGKLEKGDKSQIYTALREAREETGIDTQSLEIIGTLTPLYIPVSDIEVLPVLAYTDTQPGFQINTREVEYLIIVPLKQLLTGNRKKITKTLRVRDQVIRAPGYLIQNEYIWGATAMILSEFIEIASSTGISGH